MTVVDELMAKHRPLAVKIAGDFSRRGWRYDDAYADALVGLWNAIGGYDETKGPFGSYAYRRITGEIIDGWRREHGREDAGHRRNSRPEPLRLDMPIRNNDDRSSRTLADLLPDQLDGITAWWDAVDRAERQLTARRRVAAIRRSIRQLPARDQALIRGHMAGRTMQDLGAEFGITESRVSQIWRLWQRSLDPNAPAYAGRRRMTVA